MIGNTCEWVFSFCALFASARRKDAPPGREAVGATGSPAMHQSNKEVPLDAREDHFEMQ